MRIQTKDLPLHLKKGLASFYFIYGEEPIQRREAIELIRSEAQKQDFHEHETVEINTFSEDGTVWHLLKTRGLFSNKRFLECHLKTSLSNKNSDALLNMAKLSDEEQLILLIFPNKLETSLKKAAWFLQFEQTYTTISTSPLTGNALVQWIQLQTKRLNIMLDEDLVKQLALRTEGNLSATQQVLEKLVLLQANTPDGCNPESLSSLLNFEAQYSVFELVDTLLKGDRVRTSYILASLRNEGVEITLLNWAIAKEVRTLILLKECSGTENLHQKMESHQIWKNRREWVLAALKRHSLSSLYDLLTSLKQLDFLTKNDTKQYVWPALSEVCLDLAGGNNGP